MMMATLPQVLGRLFSVRSSSRSNLRSGRRTEGAATIEKGSKAGPLIAYDNLGEPVWSPRDYGAFACEGFMQKQRAHDRGGGGFYPHSPLRGR
jgi:hypothetical protein